MSVRWLLWSLVSPSQLILFSLALGLLLLALRRTRGARYLLGFGGLGLLLCGLLPTAILLANRLETRFPQPDLPTHVDGIILLAGAERSAASAAYGQPQLGSGGGRYATALALARRYPQARVVFTGGPRVERGRGALGTQAAVAERLFADLGLDAARLEWEEGSTDTCVSGRRTHELLQPRPDERWVVVTSAMHVPRTMACFRAAGWRAGNLIAQPADYRTVWGTPNVGSFQFARNLALFDEATHEWLGLLFYRLTGRTQEWFPAP
jgi:uncharacterized SAM-binding protein YcdF (DUF218 family)